MSFIDIDTLRGVITAALLALFIGLIAWAWSGARKDTFDAAARLPLDDGDPR